MGKYMCIHTVPEKMISKEQVDQLAQAAQQDQRIKGYRSFFNLSKGKIVCIMEAADEKAVSGWFEQMQVPVDTIVPLEFEGEAGRVRPA